MADKDLNELSMFLNDYLNGAKEGFPVANRALLALEKDPGQTERLNEVFRAVHTLKSSSAMLEFAHIAELATSARTLLNPTPGRNLPLTKNPTTSWRE